MNENNQDEYEYVYNICYFDKDEKMVKNLYKEEDYLKLVNIMNIKLFKKIVETVSTILKRCSTQVQMSLMSNSILDEKLAITKYLNLN